MTVTKINTFRIDANYAAAQGSYCAGMCALNAFTAVYLIFKGFSNAQTGATVSLLSMLAIVIQLFVSNLADSHTNIPLKKIITVLYLVTIAACTLLWVLPLPVALMIVAYSIGAATQRSIMGLLNAMMMQFTNAGLHVNYGWPRGVCSILFALTAFVLGILVERYSPDIIMPVSIGLTVFGVVSVMVMPDPRKFTAQPSNEAADIQNADTSLEKKPAQRPLSYVAMFRTNPTLSLFIAGSVILALGQSTASVFLIRIMESVGGSAQDLGTAILIQAGIEFPMLFASAWVLRKY
ncbi:MAG: MFS transporter, partial [Dehalococcoidales bacterium]|nr:MFS transporter [Dehalococcoidales bacterium]